MAFEKPQSNEGIQCSIMIISKPIKVLKDPENPGIAEGKRSIIKSSRMNSDEFKYTQDLQVTI